MNNYPHLFPVRSLFYCEFTWARDSNGRISLQSELSAFEAPLPKQPVRHQEGK
jgi:hypothetical protein